MSASGSRPGHHWRSPAITLAPPRDTHRLPPHLILNVIKAQDRHLKDAVKSGDTTHHQVREDMKGRWKHPKKSLAWYLDAKKAFAALPEE